MKCSGGRESQIEAIEGAYIDNKSNRSVDEKPVKKSNYVGQTGASSLPTSV
jgi:hypothetical protein